MNRNIVARPLDHATFAEFGDVIDKESAVVRFPINGGMTERYHGLSDPEVIGPGGRVTLSIAAGKPYSLPLQLRMVERHPLGSQAFIPLEGRPFLIVVCRGEGDRPGEPHAFLTSAGQGIQYRRNVWHGVLTAIEKAQDFLIVDRDGEGVNVEEFHFAQPYRIELPAGGSFTNL